MTLEVIPVKLGHDVDEDDSLADLIPAKSLEDGDIIIVSQKIVSKQEGRVVRLDAVIPSELALGIAAAYDKDPRLVEVILHESERIVRMRNGVIIVKTRHGFVCANAGVDESNVQRGFVTLLPSDSDASASALRQQLEQKTGKRLAVIISDTFGRPFRQGQTDCAIGISGMDALLDLRGGTDRFGRSLRVTVTAVSDEICAAADLVRPKASGMPAAIVRNYTYDPADSGISPVLRDDATDLFR